VSTFLQALGAGVAYGCLIGLVAVGYSVVYGVARLINFAHGEIFTLSAYFILVALAPGGGPWGIWPLVIIACATVTASAGFTTVASRVTIVAVGAIAIAAFRFLDFRALPIAVAIASSAVCAALVALAAEFAIYRPLVASSRLAALVASIGLSIGLQGLMQFTFGTTQFAFPRRVDLLFGHTAAAAGRSLDLTIVATTIACAVAAALFSKRATLGRSLRAVADDPTLAASLGVDLNACRRAAFAIGAIFAALAAFLFVARTRVLHPTLGYGVGILGFAAAVIGGIGRFMGAMLAGIVIGTVLGVSPLLDLTWLARWLGRTTAFLPSLEPSDWAIAIVYGVMVVVLLVKPEGLLGSREHRSI
jgi:branched-chain amino acid transport system permease protein